MSATDEGTPREPRQRLRRAGFYGLFLWACLGLALEAAHGFKASWLLDDPLRREWLRWGHAHGIGLSLMLLLYAAVGGRSGQGGDAVTARFLMSAAVLLPLGFTLGALWHYEADPGVGIALAPLGGLCLLVGLFRAAREA